MGPKHDSFGPMACFVQLLPSYWPLSVTTTKQGGALDEAFVEPVEFQSKGLSHTLLQAPPFGDSKDKVKASSHPPKILPHLQTSLHTKHAEHIWPPSGINLNYV